MKRLFLLLALLPVLAAVPASAYNGNPADDFVEEVIKVNPDLQNAVVALCAVDENGEVLAEWNADMPLLPASLLKTVTTGVVLELFGPHYSFTTLLAVDGQIRRGVLDGNVYIIGGGDPTLCSTDSLGIARDSLFAGWTMALAGAGISQIRGSIVADNRYLSADIIPGSWTWENIGESFGSGATGLNYCSNMQYIHISPAGEDGQCAVIDSVYPEIPGMKYNNTTVTERGAKNKVSYYTSDVARSAKLEGRVGEAETIHVSNKFPHLSLAYDFARYLDAHGVRNELDVKGIESMDQQTKDAVANTMTLFFNPPTGPVRQQDNGIRVVAAVNSPMLEDIVSATNRYSDNMYAEALFKHIGRKYNGVPTSASAVRALRKYLDLMGLPEAGFHVEDGSGLSRMNYVSPRFLCHFYSVMEKTDSFDEYLVSFPVPGEDGTMENTFAEEDEAVRSAIHAKTGSLSDVRCYAGYIDRPEGYVKFAVMVNNLSVPVKDIEAELQGFLKTLVTME